MKKSRMSPFLWILVVAYTLSLPYAIIVYEAITLKWSAGIAGFIPRLILILAAAAYFLCATKKGLPLRKKILLLPCGIIATIIICLESNPNKHIHIPEYILMTWLLFEVIRIDYKGAGIYLLVFLSSSLLGILDEVLQGLHPGRFYGWQDMITNTTSSFIGVLTIFGLRTGGDTDWDWIDHLRKRKWSFAVVVAGILITAISCYMLFDVKGHSGSWNIYPLWLIVLKIFLIMAGSFTIWIIFRRKGRDEGNITATLWVVPPLAIILVIDIVIVLAWGTRLPFQ